MSETKVAIVTGGSKGIGLAITKQLLLEEYQVVICSRTPEDLHKARTDLKLEGEVVAYTADVSKHSDCKRLVDFTVKKFGKVDVLINNAGVFGPVGAIDENDPAEWEQAIQINVLGVAYMSALAVAAMKVSGGGKIINLLGAGVGGEKVMPHFSAYYTSKTAVAGLTECLAREVESDNIQVNAISPGAVASNLTLSLLDLPKEVVGDEMYKSSEKLKEGKDATPAKAVELVSFLISDQATGISGRLISAKWDNYKSWDIKKIKSKNLYRLRRIDDKNFQDKD